MTEPSDNPWLPIQRRGDSELALSFARLFWPKFVERHGCVLLAHRADDGLIEEWLRRTDGDVPQTESALNHVHLYDELSESDPDDAGLMEVGRALQHCWTAALAEQFPGRAFNVQLVGSEDDYGPTLYARSSPQGG